MATLALVVSGDSKGTTGELTGTNMGAFISSMTAANIQKIK